MGRDAPHTCVVKHFAEIHFTCNKPRCLSLFCFSNIFQTYKTKTKTVQHRNHSIWWNFGSFSEFWEIKNVTNRNCLPSPPVTHNFRFEEGRCSGSLDITETFTLSMPLQTFDAITDFRCESLALPWGKLHTKCSSLFQFPDRGGKGTPFFVVFEGNLAIWYGNTPLFVLFERGGVREVHLLWWLTEISSNLGKETLHYL